MGNFNTPALLFGIILLIASIGLFLWGRIKPELQRDSDNIYAVIGIVCALILFGSAFELSLPMSFQQLLMIGSLITLMWENFQMREPKGLGPRRDGAGAGWFRGSRAERSRRGASGLDEERLSSRDYSYPEARYDDYGAAEERRPPSRRIRGSMEARYDNVPDEKPPLRLPNRRSSGRPYPEDERPDQFDGSDADPWRNPNRRRPTDRPTDRPIERSDERSDSRSRPTGTPTKSWDEPDSRLDTPGWNRGPLDKTPDRAPERVSSRDDRNTDDQWPTAQPLDSDPPPRRRRRPRPDEIDSPSDTELPRRSRRRPPIASTDDTPPRPDGSRSDRPADRPSRPGRPERTGKPGDEYVDYQPVQPSSRDGQDEFDNSSNFDD